MGEAQKVPYQELLEQARAAFEGGTDLTVAVEEEFALLDPETLSLVNRFEDVKAAAGGSAVDDHLVGELIASEAEVRTGRCETFAEASELMGMRRAQLAEITSGLGLALGATGAHPWSRWQDQRIIDTPHYRRNDELLRYVVWRNNTFGLHLHVGIAGADRAIAVHDGLRMFLPHLLALSASSPLVEGVNSGLHSARTEIFTRMFPRCGVPDAYRTWAEFDAYVRLLYETGSIDEHTQIWWSVRPHLAYPTVEIRICDAQPDLAESRALAAFGYGLTARIARAVDEGEQLPDPPPAADRGEHVARDPLRALGRALRSRRAGSPARARGARARRGVDRPRGGRARPPADDPRGERRRAPDRTRRGGLDARGDLCGAGSVGSLRVGGLRPTSLPGAQPGEVVRG